MSSLALKNIKIYALTHLGKSSNAYSKNNIHYYEKKIATATRRIIENNIHYYDKKNCSRDKQNTVRKRQNFRKFHTCYCFLENVNCCSIDLVL